MVLTDDFIESVITPETEPTNPSNTTMISREFYGMEAVAQFEEEYASSENGGEQ